MFKPARGFTLIELLVVVAIIGIVGVIVLTTNGSFGEDQKLKNGSLDVQSLIRTAKTNSSTNTVCEDSNGASWAVRFVSSSSIDLICRTSLGVDSASLKNLNLSLNNLTIQSIVSGGCTAVLPLRVSFAPLTSKITFSDSTAQACISSATTLSVNLQNTKNNNTATVTINSGGTIDVK